MTTRHALLTHYNATPCAEAGCDEAGRGCLAGAVFAAAVILPPDFYDPRIRDSKKMTASRRQEMRVLIESTALAWAVGVVEPGEIDRINILNAAILAMHRALDGLALAPEFVLVDGNRFRPYHRGGAQTTDPTPHATVVKGDDKYLAIAAASILAKTHRDEYMEQIAQQHSEYAWERNMGYPTAAHRAAIAQHGITPFHRKRFNLLGDAQQTTLW